MEDELMSQKKQWTMKWKLPQISILANTTAHPWCDSHFTSISTCGVWNVECGGQGTGFKSSIKSFHTHIYILRLC